MGLEGVGARCARRCRCPALGIVDGALGCLLSATLALGAGVARRRGAAADAGRRRAAPRHPALADPARAQRHPAARRARSSTRSRASTRSARSPARRPTSTRPNPQIARDAARRGGGRRRRAGDRRRVRAGRRGLRLDRRAGHRRHQRPRRRRRERHHGPAARDRRQARRDADRVRQPQRRRRPARPRARRTPLRLVVEPPPSGTAGGDARLPAGRAVRRRAPCGSAASRTVLTQDAYGRGPVRRQIVPLRGNVRPGNSGGPIVDATRPRAGDGLRGDRGRAPPRRLGDPRRGRRARPRQRPATTVSTGPCAQ